MTTPATIAWMITRDHNEVLAIEQSRFHSWSLDELKKNLRETYVIGMVARLGLGAYADDPIVGYMIYRANKHHLDLMKLIVHPAYRKQGIGSQMIAKLVGKLSSHRRTRITLVVRETALEGQLFLQSQGFWASDVFREHFRDEDGYVMAYKLDPTETLTPLGMKGVTS